MANTPIHRESTGVVILSGGYSSRMGYDKWKLPVGDVTMLEKIVAKALEFSKGVAVCIAPNQDINLSHLPLKIVRDVNVECGPLEGIRCGLKELANDFEFAFVTACDVPWFESSVVRLLHEVIGKNECAIPIIDDRIYGMTALYRTETHEKIDDLIRTKRLKVSTLATELTCRRLTRDQLQTADPKLDTLRNINSKSEYLNYLLEIGKTCPPEILQHLNDAAV